jgi:acetyl-CoA carboxylase biotin carboxyl carrier protein
LPPNSVNPPSFAEFSIFNFQFSITLESAVQLDLNQLCELLTVLDKTGISELTLKSGDLELTVRKGILASSPGTAAALPAAVATVPPIPLGAVASPTLASTPPLDQNLGVDVADRAPVAPAAVPPALSVPVDTKWVPIISPMVGTFYRAASPDEPPFVNVGDRIKVSQTVCIIEAMKLMNEIDADEVSGQVMEILVQNGEPVEYGQVLMRINPD